MMRILVVAENAISAGLLLLLLKDRRYLSKPRHRLRNYFDRKIDIFCVVCLHRKPALIRSNNSPLG
jgi:hypothetical protein